MVERILELMEKNENINFVLSSDTAAKVVCKIHKDGIKFGLPNEEDSYYDVCEEIVNGVAIIISQILDEEGYVYFVENYFGNSGQGKIMGDKFMPVVVEDEVEDLIDYKNIETSVVII